MAMELQKPKDTDMPQPQETLQKPHQNPPEIAAVAAPISENPHKDQGQEAEATDDKPPNPSEAVGSPPPTPTSDLQKKMRRAERFGMPVQLSEEEKRSSRAERFGTGPTVQGLEESKKSEEQKRKDRAKRFGLTAHFENDEEVKKKARLARFAGNSKSDSAEEEKRKARAIRFSQTSATNSTQTNGKVDEQKTTIAGKAGGGT